MHDENFGLLINLVQEALTQGGPGRIGQRPTRVPLNARSGTLEGLDFEHRYSEINFIFII